MRLHAIALALFALGHAAAAQQTGTVRVVIETTKGPIAVTLDSARAPRTAANFLRYVDGGYYANGRFHRTVTMTNQPNDSVRIQVIQGGADTARARDGFPPIVLERTSVTGLTHHDGTISMARGGADSATSDFFICIDDQPALDFGGHRNRDGQGFAAFGRVTSGMDIVRAIQASSADGQRLAPPIVIVRIRRVP